jgi:hypothetical protein
MVVSVILGMGMRSDYLFDMCARFEFLPIASTLLNGRYADLPLVEITSEVPEDPLT